MNRAPTRVSTGATHDRAFVLAAVVADDPKLGMLSIDAATGGTEFVIQAWLPARRRRRLATRSAAS